MHGSIRTYTKADHDQRSNAQHSKITHRHMITADAPMHPSLYPLASQMLSITGDHSLLMCTTAAWLGLPAGLLPALTELAVAGRCSDRVCLRI